MINRGIQDLREEAIKLEWINRALKEQIKRNEKRLEEVDMMLVENFGESILEGTK